MIEFGYRCNCGKLNATKSLNIPYNVQGIGIIDNDKISATKNYAGAVPYTNAFFGRASGSLLLDNVQCRGSEDNVLNCSRNPVGVLHSSCDHGDDVGVQCPGKNIVTVAVINQK